MIKIKKYFKKELTQTIYIEGKEIRKEDKDNTKTAEFLRTLLATFAAKFLTTFSIELVIALIDKIAE